MGRLNGWSRGSAAALGLGLLAVSCAGAQRPAAAPAAVPPGGAEHGSLIVDHLPGGEPVTLWYQVLGTGGPLVIKPNAAQSSDLSELARDRRLVLYDARGRGRSSRFGEGLPVGLEHDLADLDALVEHLVSNREERVSLLGGSYYGALVALYAARHPERVERLVMIGPMPLTAEEWNAHQAAQPENPELAADREELDRLRAQGLEERDPEAFCRASYAVSARHALFHDPAVAAAYDPTYCALPNEQPASMNAWVQALFATLPAWDFRAAAAAVEAPTLVVQGRHDRMVPPAGAGRWAELIPGARVLEVEAGHVPLHERPETVLPALDDFLPAR